MKRIGLVFLGLVLAFACINTILFLLARWGGMLPAPMQHGFRILAIGESTTQGAAGFAYETTYTSQLEKILRTRCPKLEAQVINQGVAGIHSPEIYSALPEWLGRFRPQLVIGMIGINDYQLSETKKEIVDVSASSSWRALKLVHWLASGLREKFDPYLNPNKIRFHDSPEKLKEKLLNAGSLPDSITYNNLVAQKLSNLALDQEQILSFHQAILNKHPHYTPAMLASGIALRTLGHINQAIEIHARAVDIAPPQDRDWIRFQLAIDYLEAKDWTKLKAVGPNLNSPFLQFLLASSFMEHGEWQRAKHSLQESTERFPNDGRLAYLLSEIYEREKNFKFMNAQRKRGEKIFLNENDFITSVYYKKIARLLAQNNIALVAMQYPMRPIASLQRTLAGEHAYFIDNEVVFRDALKKSSYEEIFYDRFAGNFGHLTAQGNGILAENIFSVIIKDVPEMRDGCVP